MVRDFNLKDSFVYYWIPSMKPVLMGSIGLVFFPTWMVDSYSKLVGKQSKRPMDLSWGYELGLFAILLDDDSLRLPGTCFDVKRTVEVKSIKTLTLLGTKISPTSPHFWVDDFPFPKVGYVIYEFPGGQNNTLIDVYWLVPLDALTLPKTNIAPVRNPSKKEWLSGRVVV